MREDAILAEYIAGVTDPDARCALRALRRRIEALEAPRCLKCDREAMGNEGPPEHARMCPRRAKEGPPIVEPRVGQQFVRWCADEWHMDSVERIEAGKSYFRTARSLTFSYDDWRAWQRSGRLRVLPAAPEGGGK